jgi:SET domain
MTTSSICNSFDPSDLSALYFRDNANHRNACTVDNRPLQVAAAGDDDNNKKIIYAGPIQVRGSSLVGGRGLFVTRSVAAGELLFIAQPNAHAPVSDVLELYLHQQQPPAQQQDEVGGDQQPTSGLAAAAAIHTVSEVSEECLVRVIMEQQQQRDPSLCAALRFLHQQQQQQTTTTMTAGVAATSGGPTTSSNGPPPGVVVDDEALMSLLLGGGEDHCPPSPSEPPEVTTTTNLTVEDVTQIVRRNAFGPDFTTPESIQAQWQLLQQQQQQQEPADHHGNNNSSSHNPPFLPPRLLGLYALPAMINHSCLPNAVRVFVGNTMVVHACQTIPANGEIVWSYIPVIQPHRRQRLQQSHGFICRCDRCTGEATLLLDHGNDGNGDGDDTTTTFTTTTTTFVPPPYPTIVSSVDELEESIIPSLSSNELRRYMRVSHLPVYLHELNRLDDGVVVPPDPQRWMPLGMQLHLALAACHNASTEHLSVRKKRGTWYSAKNKPDKTTVVVVVLLPPHPSFFFFFCWVVLPRTPLDTTFLVRTGTVGCETIVLGRSAPTGGHDSVRESRSRH